MNRVQETLICQKGRRCMEDAYVFVIVLHLYACRCEFQEHTLLTQGYISSTTLTNKIIEYKDNCSLMISRLLFCYDTNSETLRVLSASHALTGNGCAKCILSIAHPSVALSTRSMFPTELAPSWGQFLEQGGNSCGWFRQGLEQSTKTRLGPGQYGSHIREKSWRTLLSSWVFLARSVLLSPTTDYEVWLQRTDLEILPLPTSISVCLPTFQAAEPGGPLVEVGHDAFAANPTES